MIYLNSKKFRDYNNLDYQKFSFFLLKKCSDYGKEKPPIVQEVINWSVEIGKAYPSLSLEDLSLAFSLALTGQLSWRIGDEFKNQNLDQFVWNPFLTTCKVSTGYMEYRRSKMKVYNRLLNDLASEKESVENANLMWEKYIKEWKNSLLSSFKEFKENKTYTLQDTYCSYFKQLNWSNLIDLTTDEIEQIKITVNKEINNLVSEEINKISGIDVKEILEIKTQLKIDTFKAQCCTIAIKKQFEKWVEKKVNVISLINNIKLIK